MWWSRQDATPAVGIRTRCRASAPQRFARRRSVLLCAPKRSPRRRSCRQRFIAVSPSIAAAPNTRVLPNSASGPRSTPRVTSRRAGAHHRAVALRPTKRGASAGTALSRNRPLLYESLRYGESDSSRPGRPIENASGGRGGHRLPRVPEISRRTPRAQLAPRCLEL